MKKIFYLLFPAAITIGSASAQDQDISTDKVPIAVTKAFSARFPSATKTKWEMEKSEYEANFKLNGEDVSANFDNTGNWLETETEIKASALPSAVQASLKKDFADWKIEEASKIESMKNGSCYEAEIEKGKDKLNVLFAKDGKVLSSTKEDEEKDDKD